LLITYLGEPMKYRTNYPTKDLVPMGDRMVRRVWEVEQSDPNGQWPTTRARVEVRDGKPELREFSLTATAQGKAIDPADVHVYDIEGMIEYMGGLARAIDAGWENHDDLADPSVITVEDLMVAARAGIKDTRHARRTTITDEKLREVAAVYRAAERWPVKAVAEHFGVQRRMAGIYVAKARQRRFLSEGD